MTKRFFVVTTLLLAYQTAISQSTKQIIVPPITGQSVEVHPGSPDTNLREVTIFRDAHFKGQTLNVRVIHHYCRA
jgi:hypothetical protein